MSEQRLPVRRSIANGIDWAVFYQLTLRHRVTPTVWKVLKAAAASDIPFDFVTLAEKYTQVNARRNLELASTIVLLTRLFHQNGIRSIVLKGIGFAVQAYHEWASRHAGDIDLFVDAHDLNGAVNLLKASGFRRMEYDIDPLSKKFKIFMKGNNQILYSDPARHIGIELHWRLFPQQHLLPLTFNAAWQDSQSIAMANSTLHTLSRHHTLLHACCHGAQHLWYRLFWLYDVALCISRFSDTDWCVLTALVKHLRVHQSVAQALYLVHNFFDVQLPSAGYRLMSTGKDRNRNLRRVMRLMFEFDAGPCIPFSIPHLIKIQHDLALRNNDAERIFYLCRYLAPSLRDFNAILLPDAAAFLYYPLRPIIWIYRKIIGKDRDDVFA
jgi:hypothetical protein